jgi:hypothetical protein
MHKVKMPQIIGRAHFIDLVDLGLKRVPAKIDTGADKSSIWVNKVELKDNHLECVFFGPKSPFYTGKVVKFKDNYSMTRVSNSFGQKELRYTVKLRIRVEGRLVYATFTLSDRSRKTYPILLGRSLLNSKFIVDVSKGDPLLKIERKKTRVLKKYLNKLEKHSEN